MGDRSVRHSLGLGLFLITLGVCAAGAQELVVSYADGDVQARTGSAWAALAVGDRLGPQASLQLGAGAYVELQWAGTRIVFSERGTYFLRDILASSRALSSAGVGKAIATTLSLLLMGPTRNQSSSLGARGANTGKQEDSDWVTSSAQVFVDAGEQYLKSGKYNEAILQLLKARDSAAEDEMRQVRFDLATAYSLSGDTRAALKQAADLQPSSADEWASDFIILKAKLLVDTNAFVQDIAWLTQKGNDLSTDAQRAAVYYFLLGVGYRGVGDTSNANASLSKVVAISAGSDLGRAAAQLLQNPQGG
jgi:tetratricopeptide (TPR) repeat protein